MWNLLLGLTAIASGYVASEGANGNRIARSILDNFMLPPDYTVEGELVSVVIPCYKEEDYIENVVTAISNQTYRPIEVIISDESDYESMVKTSAIVEQYGASFIHNDAKNVSIGRNLGARVAKGHILLFLDADAIIGKDYVERLVKCLNREGVYLSHGVDVQISDDNTDISVFAQGGHMISNNMASINSTHTRGSGLCMRFDDFWLLNGFDEGMDAMVTEIGEDWELGARVVEKWGINSIFFDKGAFAIDIHRRPAKKSGTAVWSDRAWRKGQSFD